MHRPACAKLKLAAHNDCRAHGGLNLVGSQSQQQDATYHGPQGPPSNLHASEIWRRQTWKEQQQLQHVAPSVTLPLHRGQLPLRPSPGHSRLGMPMTGQASLQAGARQDQQLNYIGPAAAQQAAQLLGPRCQGELEGFPVPAARSGTQWQYRKAPAGQDAHMLVRHQPLQQSEDFTDGQLNAAGPELAQQQADNPGQQPALWPNQVFRQQQASCTSHGHLHVPSVHMLGALPLLLPLPHVLASALPAAHCIHIRVLALQAHFTQLPQEQPQECPASQSSARGPHQLPHQYYQPGEPLPASSLLGLHPQASQTDEINMLSQSVPAARLPVGRTLALPTSETQGDPFQHPWRSNVPPLSPVETLSFERPSQSLAGTAVAGRRLQGPSGAETGAHQLAAAAVLAAPAAGSQGGRRVTAGTTSPVTSSRSRAPEQVGWAHTSDPLLLASG